MIECETTARKWGNSIGLTLPKEIVKNARIKEQEKIRILILKQNCAAGSTFGMARGKWNKNTQRLKDTFRKELHGG